jgi:DNA-binding LacI/PurR family transcriptional regulator
MRIEQAASAFGYEVRPHATAGPLRSAQLTIGVVVTGLADYYAFDALTGLSSTIQTAGHRLDLTDLTENEFDTSALQRAAAACDGLVLMSPRIDEAVLREFCDPARTVLTHRRIEGYSSVALEESSGMLQALRHLASLGHQKIAYVAGPEESWANRHRRQSFEEHSTRLGIEPALFGPFRPTYEGGVIAADTVMMEESITAVVAYNDLVASGLVVRLLERGVRVPEDVSVVGMDDSILAQVLRPQLTSVSTLQSKIGKTAAQIILMLLTQRAGRGVQASGAEGAQNVLMPEGFVVRGSTGVVRPAS